MLGARIRQKVDKGEELHRDVDHNEHESEENQDGDLPAREERFEIGRQNLSQTLDLRGYRCEDALCELENYLDKASLYNLSPVYVIHGHGTGILKQAVRDFAKTSPYVAKFRIGEPSEGGDGVIVIDIK